MKQSKNSCALFIGSCDAYADILDPFFTLLKRYWPDLKYDIFLSTESINYKHPGLKIQNIHPDNPDCSWTERIYDALKKIKAKQIIFMLDDFFLYDKVNSNKISDVVSWLSKDPSIATFTLWNIVGHNKNSKYPGFDLREKKAHYKMAMVAGLWNKKWLLRYLKNQHESAWGFEEKAGAQSRKKIFPGKFFVITESLDNIIPYNLAKYGLYSGKWIKDTKKLFENNKITFNFKKRGWHNDKYLSTTQSRKQAFSLQHSSILPCCYLKNKTLKKIYNNDPIAPGVFRQVYHIKNGKNLIRWYISSINGFSISNLKIKITYQDGMQKLADNRLLFGQFKKIGSTYVFNTFEPSIFVITEPDKVFKTVEITGKIIFPASKKHLQASYQQSTEPKNKYSQNILDWFWIEQLSSKDIMTYSSIQPQITFDNKTSIKDAPLSDGKFTCIYSIPTKTNSIRWVPSNSVGYMIKNLKVKLINSKNQQNCRIKNIIERPKKINGWYIFNTPPKSIEINTHKYDKIIITGKIKHAIKPRYLRKITISKQRSI